MDFPLMISVWLLSCSDALGLLLQQILLLAKRKFMAFKSVNSGVWAIRTVPCLTSCPEPGSLPIKLSFSVMPGGKITCHQKSVGSAACLSLHTVLPSAPSPLVLKKNPADKQRFLLLLVMRVCRCLLGDKPLWSGSLWHSLDPLHHHQCQVLQDQ